MSEAARRALAESAAAVKLDRETAAKGPPTSDAQMDLANSLLRWGRVQLAAGASSATAAACAREAYGILRRLAEARPTDLSAALALGDTFEILLRFDPAAAPAAQGELREVARAHLSRLSLWPMPQSRIDAARLTQLRASLGTLVNH
jgi:hypothetical protein